MICGKAKPDGEKLLHACRVMAPAALAALWMLASCAGPFVPMESASEEVERALQSFRRCVLQGDHAAVAAMYAEEAEISHGDGTPVRGRAAIRAFLESFQAYRVREYQLAAADTTVDVDHARQAGTYRQRVTLPDGNTVEASGRFVADWMREPQGQWRIQRMATFSP